LVELVWRVHRFLFRASGGRIGSRDGDRYVVFATHAGEDRDPPWWHNLRHAGEGDVLVDGKRMHVRAREAEGAERDRLWSEVKGRDDAFAEYEERTTRSIAVVVLEPWGGSELRLASR